MENPEYLQRSRVGVRKLTPTYSLQDGASRPLFDFDTYKILTRYLLGGKKRPEIVPLGAA